MLQSPSGQTSKGALGPGSRARSEQVSALSRGEEQDAPACFSGESNDSHVERMTSHVWLHPYCYIMQPWKRLITFLNLAMLCVQLDKSLTHHMPAQCCFTSSPPQSAVDVRLNMRTIFSSGLVFQRYHASFVGMCSNAQTGAR